MHGTGRPLGKYTVEVPAQARVDAGMAAATLRASQRVLVLGHVGADGDVAGSALGLALALRELGKDVVVYNEKPLDESLSWLPGATTWQTSLPVDARFDATVVVDAADPGRCGRHFPAPERRGVFVWIDHHRIDLPPGDLNYVDLTAAAVGEQIAEILVALGHELSRDVATCLYLSAMSDTGGFRYANTSARILNLAARCVAAGVEPWLVTQRLYESQPEARVRLLGRALERLVVSPCGRVGVATLRSSDLLQLCAEVRHVHGIVNHIRGIAGIEIAGLVHETESEPELIIRSRGRVSAGAIATLLGGAGHQNAAKLRLKLSLADAAHRFLDVAVQVMDG